MLEFLKNNISTYGILGLLMDTAIIVFIIVIIEFVLTFIRMTSKDKHQKKIGNKYEDLVAKDFEKNIGEVVRNIIIPDGKGGTTELDMAVVTTKGVFCVECKHRQGDLYGSINTPVWKVKANNDSTIGELENPISQNYGHIKNLENLLENELTTRKNELPLYNIIVVNTNFQYVNMGKTLEITKYYKLPDRNIVLISHDKGKNGIKTFAKDADMFTSVYSDEQVTMIANELRKYSGTKEDMKAHVEYVKNSHGEGI